VEEDPRAGLADDFNAWKALIACIAAKVTMRRVDNTPISRSPAGGTACSYVMTSPIRNACMPTATSAGLFSAERAAASVARRAAVLGVRAVARLAHRAARTACRAALEGAGTIEAAREQFIRAAREAGILAGER
jgi:hypothetical protein